MSIWAKRAMQFGGVFLVGALAGAGVTVWKVALPMTEMAFFMASAHEEQRAYVSYRYADYSVARVALIDHIHYLQDVEKKHDRSASAEPKGNVFLWYGRLALAAERAGRTTEAHAFFEQGLAEARAQGGRIVEADLRESVGKLDADWDAGLRGHR